jgi:hypothetical protein
MFHRIGRKANLLIFALALFAFAAMPVALADQNILMYDDYQRIGTHITVHIIEINITDHQMGNFIPSPDAFNVKYAKVVYTFENTGDTEDKGYLNVSFIDSNGNEYNREDYTGEPVPAHSTSVLDFMEIAVPKNSTLVKIKITQGFSETFFDIPQITATPSAQTTASGNGATKSTGCIPLLPFAAVGGIGAIGLVINKYGLKR